MKVLNIICLTVLLPILFSCNNEPAPNPPEEMVGMDGAEETTTTSYDTYQETFVMAMLSNMTGSEIEGTGTVTVAEAEGAFERNVRSAFEATTSKPEMQSNGSWELVWGPEVVVKNGGSNSDYNVKDGNFVIAATQTVFVAKKGTEYVVAIAGTNSNSKYDLFEDEATGTYSKTEWPYLAVSTATENVKVTPGTKDALLLIETMSSGSQTLGAFLSTLQDATMITVTGHSLGGGLTPPMGLALFHAETTFPGVEASVLSKIPHRIYPLAAPDVGTADFVTLLQDSTLFPVSTTKPSVVYQQWNQKIWNSKDIVPRAWSKEYLKSIFDIYDGQITTPAFVVSAINYKYNVSDKKSWDKHVTVHPYTTMDPNSLGQFAGTFIPPSSIPGNNCSACMQVGPKAKAKAKEKAKNINDVVCPYFLEVLHQHIPAYFEYFGIDESVLAPPNIDACKVAEGLAKI